MDVEQHFRQPNQLEREIIARLSSGTFLGKNEIAQQLQDCEVRIIDSEGSLELKPSVTAKPATVEKRIPVEAEGMDEDGIHIHILLHIVSGFVNELEVYKDDGSAIRRMPEPNTLVIITLPP